MDATPEPSPEEQGLARMLDQKLLAVLDMMHRAGVPFLAGTDIGSAYLIPGFSLHSELTDLVEAGFTPLQALQSATRDAARFSGQEKDWGTVQKCKLADLVLLNANPLENIGNTRQISAVVVNGKMLDRRTLDTMLDKIQTADQK